MGFWGEFGLWRGGILGSRSFQFQSGIPSWNSGVAKGVGAWKTGKKRISKPKNWDFGGGFGVLERRNFGIGGFGAPAWNSTSFISGIPTFPWFSREESAPFLGGILPVFAPFLTPDFSSSSPLPVFPFSHFFPAFFPLFQRLQVPGVQHVLQPGRERRAALHRECTSNPGIRGKIHPIPRFFGKIPPIPVFWGKISQIPRFLVGKNPSNSMVLGGEIPDFFGKILDFLGKGPSNP